MAKIFNLANEVLASIFKHLDGLDLGTVAKTCQRFRNASVIDQIWQHLCERGKYCLPLLAYQARENERFNLLWKIVNRIDRLGQKTPWFNSTLLCNQRLG